MKKLSLAALSLALVLGLLAGCAPKAPAETGAPSATPSETPAPTETAPAPSTPATTGGAVKTGLALLTNVEKSKAATADAEGTAQANIGLYAVTVGADGVIDACVIDAIQSKIAFNAKGEITTDKATLFDSKNVLGEKYGMAKASPIKKEWNEQAAAFAAYAVGKKVEDLKGIAVNEKGAATAADLTSSVTIAIGEFITGIEAAVKNATELGAQKGDKLGLASATNMAKSKNVDGDKPGVAQAYATIAAVTTKDGKITSCAIDAVQANVNFDAKGAITTDLTAAIASKNELGDKYGMKAASKIGKEWNEQAAAFAAYVTGKTVADVKGIAVGEKGEPTVADLTSSVTIGIGELQELVEKAAG